MALLAPPPAPPRVATIDDDGRQPIKLSDTPGGVRTAAVLLDTLRERGDDEGRRQFRLRVTQVSAKMVTLFVTTWVCTLGAIPAIIALAVAKHILVAILIMGLGVDAPDHDTDHGPVDEGSEWSRRRA